MIYLLFISIILNVFLIIRMVKANEILKEIKRLDEFVKQEKEKTRILSVKLKEKINISEMIEEVEKYVATH